MDLRQRWEESLGDLTELNTADTVRPPADAAPVESPAEEFRPLGLIGSGGMGVVYRAHQASLDREVALKTLRPDLRGSPRARADFVAEARATGDLEHPNIVPVHALGSLDPQGLFLALKLVGGTSWEEALRSGGHERLFHLEVLQQVCHAVAFAHSRGILHNDLKPSNVMLGDFGEVLVMDWGLAVVFESPRARPGLRARESIASPCGTPCYMAPEQASGEGAQLGPWTDVYLLGGLLFRILHGRAPHGGLSAVQVIARCVAAKRPAIDPDLPRPLRELCAASLAPDPDARPQTVAAFQRRLGDYLRQRESLLISADAARRLESCVARGVEELAAEARGALYEDFAEAIAGFQQALTLYPASAEGRDGLDRARRAYAEVALAQGELGLARAQAERLTGEEPKTALLARVDTAREARARDHEQRARLARRLRWAGRAALVAALAVALVTAALLRQVQTHRERSERRAAISNEALSRLVDEVQVELFDGLGSPAAVAAGKRLLALADSSWAALAAVDADGRRERIGQLEARLRQVELRLDVEGDLVWAHATLPEVRAQAEALVAEEPSATARRLAARALWLSSVVDTQYGAFDTGEARLREALTLCPPDGRLRGRVLDALGRLLVEVERYGPAAELAAQAAALLRPGAEAGLPEVCTYVDALLGQAHVASSAQDDAALAASLARVSEALEPWRESDAFRVVSQRVELLFGRSVLAANRGELAEAEEALAAATAQMTELHARHPGHRDIFASPVVAQAAAARSLGLELPEALAAYDRLIVSTRSWLAAAPRSIGRRRVLLEQLRLRGDALARAGRFEEAIADFEEARGLARERAEAFPALRAPRLRLLHTEVELARVLTATGQDARAAALFTGVNRSFRAGDPRRDIVAALAQEADFRLHLGELGAADSLLVRATQAAEPLPVSRLKVDLLLVRLALEDSLGRRADSLHVEAVAAARSVADAAPKPIHTQRLAEALFRRAARGAAAEAAREGLERWVASFDGLRGPEEQWEALKILRLALDLEGLPAAALEEAVAAAHSAALRWQELLPERSYARHQAALAGFWRAQILLRLGRAAEALARAQEARETLAPLVALDADPPEGDVASHANIRTLEAVALGELGHADEGLAVLGLAVELLERRLTASPDEALLWRLLAQAGSYGAGLAAGCGQSPRPWLQLASDAGAALCRLFPGNPAPRRARLSALLGLGDLLEAEGDAAAEVFEEAFEVGAGLLALSPDPDALQLFLYASERASHLRYLDGDLAAADARYTEGVAILRGLLARDPDLHPARTALVTLANNAAAVAEEELALDTARAWLERAREHAALLPADRRPLSLVRIDARLAMLARGAAMLDGDAPTSAEEALWIARALAGDARDAATARRAWERAFAWPGAEPDPFDYVLAAGSAAREARDAPPELRAQREDQALTWLQALVELHRALLPALDAEDRADWAELLGWIRDELEEFDELRTRADFRALFPAH